jgi:hypothetical protein
VDKDKDKDKDEGEDLEQTEAEMLIQRAQQYLTQKEHAQEMQQPKPEGFWNLQHG